MDTPITPTKGDAKLRVKRPLVARLILIISLIVLVSASAITALATAFFAGDSRARAEDQNLTMNELVASQAESEIRNVHRGALALLDLFRGGEGVLSDDDRHVADYFARNASVLSVALAGRSQATNECLLAACEIDHDALDRFIENSADLVERAKAGETILTNASPWVGTAAAALFAPYRDAGADDALIVAFTSESLQSLVGGNGSSRTIVFSSEGTAIADADQATVLAGSSLADDPAIARCLESSSDNLQFRYVGAGGEGYIAAFHKVGIGNFSVLSTIPTADLYAAAFGVARQNLYITAIVLIFSVLAVWFFARSVTKPILALVSAARAIERGEYEVSIAPSTSDELGLLTESFAAMGKGLAERERIKETFGKFVNREIAERALTGKLSLGGDRKTATIFFSDIRSFTAISEKLAPEAVVEFLNDYMTRMVDCVERTGGVVDKFIGDAIMAVWGAPVSRGSPAEDALRCVTAALMMREALLEFNRGRGGPGKPIIRIGCGINTGPCLAGQIGSAHRMEYTVIGDAVNLASRIEALNKPFATDVLISENTYELVRDRVVVERMLPITVKGKSEPLSIFAVVNVRGADGPNTLADVRSALGVAAPSGAVNPEAEEVKYEILKK